MEPGLIDFDIAYDIQSQAEPGIAGTPGYMSPQQSCGMLPIVSDDIYSLGMVLYFLTTNVDPALTPWQHTPTARPVSLLNPAISDTLRQIIAYCLADDPRERFTSAQALAIQLALLEHYEPVEPQMTKPEECRRDTEELQLYSQLARRRGDTLCQTAHRSTRGVGKLWYTGTGDRDVAFPNVSQGSAGTILVLAEPVHVFQEPVHRAILTEGVQWLLSRPRNPKQAHPGLYTGEAGIGATLLRVGQVLGDQELITAAVELGRWISTLPYISPDLMSGVAGRLRFHLWLYDQTGDCQDLRCAVKAGEWLLSVAQETGDGGLCWALPLNHQSSEQMVGIVGYAHGAAGIGDVLLDLFETTGDERFSSGARRSADWITHLAVPALNDGSGLAWPKIVGEEATKSHWASGAAGIGHFLLHAAQCTLFPKAIELATQAARTCAYGTRWQGPTQAYGLAGNIEFLLDMFQYTGIPAYLSEATLLAHALQAFKTEQDGMLIWHGNTLTPLSASYMSGYAGVAACLLRLSSPKHMPHLLSRQGLQCRQTAGCNSRAPFLRQSRLSNNL